MKLILRDAVVMSALGIPLGAAAAIVMGIATLPSLALSAVGVMVIAISAAVLPSCRATTVDPAHSLRGE